MLVGQNLDDSLLGAHLTSVDVLDRIEVGVLLDVMDDALVGVALRHPLLMKMDCCLREVGAALQRKD